MSMGDITHSIHEILKSTYQIVNMRGPADVLFKNYQRHCFDDQPENGPLSFDNGPTKLPFIMDLHGFISLPCLITRGSQTIFHS